MSSFRSLFFCCPGAIFFPAPVHFHLLLWFVGFADFEMGGRRVRVFRFLHISFGARCLLRVGVDHCRRCESLVVYFLG